MSRIPYPENAEPAPGVYGERVLNGQRMIAHLPGSIAAKFQDFATAVTFDGTLPRTLREIVILRVGHLTRADYVVHHHTSMARKYGVPDEVLDQIASIKPQGLSEKEQSIIRFIDQIVLNVRPDNECLSDVRKYVSNSELMELLFAAGLYIMFSRVIVTAGIDLDDSAVGESASEDWMWEAASSDPVS